MVRANPAPSRSALISKSSLESLIERQIKSLSSSNLLQFFKRLHFYFTFQTPSELAKNAYSLLAVSLVIQEQIQIQPFFTDISKKTLTLFSRVFDLHKNTKVFLSSSVLFREVQHVLNCTCLYASEILKQDRSKKSIFLLLQLLSLYPKKRFELFVTGLLRIIENNSLPSAYSYITNRCFPYLPIHQKQMTLVLGLHGTLGRAVGNQFFARPGNLFFLNEMSKKFEIVLFSSMAEEYSNYAITVVDPSGIVDFRLYKHHMRSVNKKHVKDLLMLGRDLKKVIIIDSQKSYFANQLKIGIEVREWRGEQDDNELAKLVKAFDEARDLYDAEEIVSIISRKLE